jgi:hypothetical protein
VSYGSIELEIELLDDNEIVHNGRVVFQVFEMSKNDMIIGLPAIIRTFGNLFTEKIMSAILREKSEAQDTAEMYLHTDILATMTDFMKVDTPYGTVFTSPWTLSIDTIAPEELSTPTPCSFTYALHYMEMSVEEATNEYYALVDDGQHVLKDFADATDVRRLLREKGVKCFVPQNWTGINGLEPLELTWRETLPPKMKPAQRNVNPRLLDAAKLEFERLKQYMYVDSNSDICSPLVIAPKATKPFIRYCGDYVKVNTHIEIGHYPIPEVVKSLEKIWGFKIFVDLDMVNSFHQIKLADTTSQRLSVQTPWGQVRPLFMPEGIGPASGVLQYTVASVFQDFVDEGWAIVIFDNFLVCAHDYDDAYTKLERVIDRCIQRNLFLKFSKSWLGFDYANFFGYVVRYNKYELSQERKDEIMNIPFPNTIKSMQSFLGSALFFKSFMPGYSTLCAPLNDTIRKEFDWKNRSEWKMDYEATFTAFKLSLQDATALHYPDYTLDWVLRVDASTLGVAAALMMRKPVNDPMPKEGKAIEYVLIPIAFASQKFSPQAKNWAIIEQEAYSCFFGIKKFEYYLRCKHFTLETDHNNLIWMEASSVPKVIRWRIYMQGFSFVLRHIPGKLMKLVDHNSRHFAEDAPTAGVQPLPVLTTLAESRRVHFDDTVQVQYIDRSCEHSQFLNPDRSTAPACKVILRRDGQHRQLPLESTFKLVMSQSLKHHREDMHSHKQPHVLQSLFSGLAQFMAPIDVLPPDGGEVGLVQPVPDQPVQDYGFTPLEALKQCHNGRIGHGGVRKTWLTLNKLFPGHRLPYKIIQSFVSSCPTCQKDRLSGMNDALKPLVRHLKRSGSRSCIGLDTLTVTPPDIYGNKYLTVIVNHFTKLVAAYPSSEHNAKTAAAALYQYFCTYGLIDEIVTDPGIEFMNEVMQQLTTWFGVTHTFSLVDRHESNGVERTNLEILRHLKALVMDERLKKKWSDPTVLSAVIFIINNSVSSESGVVPFHATFGNQNATYFKIPEYLDGKQKTHEYVKELTANLELITKLSKQFQDEIVKERTKDSDPVKQNQYQKGDFVFFQLNTDHFLPSKLTPKFAGPYEVINQHKNDVQCKDMIQGEVKKFHVERLKLFHFEGSPEDMKKEAFRLAQIDNDQHVVNRIVAYRGDIGLRSTMEFEVEYYDGSRQWRPYGIDIFNTIAYEDLCDITPELLLHRYTVAVAQIRATEIKKKQITDVDVGDSVFVDLRQYNVSGWYDQLPLDDLHHKKYVLKYRYDRWTSNKKRKIHIVCDLTDDHYHVDNLWVKQFGSTKIFNPETMIMMDEQFLIDHPEVLSDRNRAQIVQRCKDALQNA